MRKNAEKLSRTKRTNWNNEVKKLDITSVVSLIVSSIAILISILGVLYSRRRTKLMEKQFQQQHEQLSRKKRFEEVSKTILQVVRLITENSKLEDFRAVWMAEISSEVLSFIHDRQLKTFDLNVKPQKITVSFQSCSKEYVSKDFREVERIVADIKKEITRSPNVVGSVQIPHVVGSVYYIDCKPSIFSQPWIETGDILVTIEKLYFAYGLLENYGDDIAFFDNVILYDLKQVVDSILRVVLESLVSEHKISFSSTDKSIQILRKLENEILGLESISVLLKELSNEICDKRLIPIQREIFSKS